MQLLWWTMLYCLLKFDDASSKRIKSDCEWRVFTRDLANAICLFLGCDPLILPSGLAPCLATPECYKHNTWVLHWHPIMHVAQTHPRCRPHTW